MSELPLEIPFIGNRVAVGLMFQLHIVMVAAIMGAAIVAPICEIVGLRRKDPRFERLAHDLAGIIVRFFAFAATWAVVGILLLVGLYPTLIGTLLSIFFWPAVAISLIWGLMTFGAYFYAYGWERYSNRRVLHNAFGWLFAISAFLFIDLITALSSFQLTPVEPVSLLAAVLNPSWITEVLHRHFGNLSYVGLVMAGIASARLLFERRDPDRAYLDWVGHFGLLLGVGVLLLQPVVGWFYAAQVRSGSPEAFQRMHLGENAWMFTVQSLFLAGLFLLGNIYMSRSAASRGEASPGSLRIMRLATIGMAILGLLIIIPPQLPLGSMTPWKYLSLMGFILLGGTTLFLYLRSSSTNRWGRVQAGSQWALIGLAIVAVSMMITMGIIRSSARGDDSIVGRLPSQPPPHILSR